MIEPTVKLMRYLRSPPRGWWRWSADGTALEWSDGRTIAMRAEVQEVLALLAPFGFPPFDAIVLLLAACRENLARQGLGARLLDPLRGELLQAAEPLRSLFAARFDAVRAGLEKIAALPREQRSGPAQKAALAQAVFEKLSATCVALSVTETETITQTLRQGFNLHEFISESYAAIPPTKAPENEHEYRWLLAIQALHDGLTRLDPAALALRAKTGLEQLVQPAEIDMPPVEKIRGLLKMLENDPELGGLTRLTKNLMAAIHLPHPLLSHEELPLGGVSDIANRGPLDRLLVSELANDDLTLAVRVALNEALYLRRETPPRNPHRRRAILIDTGIRLWGVPRVFATAVALALAAMTDAQADLQIFRTKGAGVEPADLTTRDGLLAQLAALEPDPQPGAALRPFLRAAAKENDPAATFRKSGENAPLDAILITHQDCLEDAEFRRALAPAKPGAGTRPSPFSAPLFQKENGDAGVYRFIAPQSRATAHLNCHRSQAAGAKSFARPRCV